MASTSEVKSTLDAVAVILAEQKAVLEKAILNASAASAALAAIPGDYTDEIATIQGYTDTGEPFEINAKSEFSLLAAERVALKTEADTIAAITLP